MEDLSKVPTNNISDVDQSEEPGESRVDQSEEPFSSPGPIRREPREILRQKKTEAPLSVGGTR